MKRRNFLQVVGLAIATFFGQSSVIAAQRATLRRAARLTPVHRRQARSIGKQLVRSRHLSFSALDRFVAKTPRSNIMAGLFAVFRESIIETNKDKRYWLQKLKTHNEIAAALGDYLKELNDAAGQSGNKNEPCSASKAVATTYKLETALNNTERKIRRLPRLHRAKPAIRALRRSLSRDRRLIRKARAIYQRQRVKTGSKCS